VRTSDFDYELPEALIAQHPVEPRDAARLLVLYRADGRVEHRVFREIGAYLRPGDLLVVNDTRVLRARLRGRLADTGGAVEALLLRDLGGGYWEALVRPARRLRPGRRVLFAGTAGTVEAEVDAVRAGAPLPRRRGSTIVRRNAAPALHSRTAGRRRTLPDGLRARAGQRGRAYGRPALHPAPP